MTHLLTQDYFTACSDVYGDDEGFRALLEALTASEDFHTFQQMMRLVTWAQGSPSRVYYGFLVQNAHLPKFQVMLSNHARGQFGALFTQMLADHDPI